MGNMNQRWRDGETRWRPAGEVIQTSLYEVAAIPNPIAKEFVCRQHYSGTFPAARFRYGLYRGSDLQGVAVFSHPCSDRVLTNVFPGDVRASVELGRFVLLDHVPGNGESWFLARCFELLRGQGIAGVVSFSDPLPRATIDGRTVLPGHVGTIYQATNAVYLGRGDARTLNILPDGRAFSHRAEVKIRRGEQGWRYAAAQLVSAGARPMEDGEEAAAWVAGELARISRRVRHRGNHKYAFAIDRALRGCLPRSLPYPKVIDVAA